MYRFWSRGEALFMLLLYVGYCVSLHFNVEIERWANTLPLPCKPGSPEEASHLVTYRTLPEDPHQQQQQQQQPPPQSFDNFGWDDPVPLQQQQPPQQLVQPEPGKVQSSSKRKSTEGLDHFWLSCSVQFPALRRWCQPCRNTTNQKSTTQQKT